METKCAHKGCTCNDATVEAEAGRFCSAACANEQKNLADAMCGCGHAGCEEHE